VDYSVKFAAERRPGKRWGAVFSERRWLRRKKHFDDLDPERVEEHIIFI